MEETIQISPETTYSTTPLFYQQNEKNNHTDQMLEDTPLSIKSEQTSPKSISKK